MSLNKNKKKLSLAASSSVANPQMQMSQMSQMWPMPLFNPWMSMGSPNMAMACASGPSSSKSRDSADMKKKPWESSESDTDDDDDFVAPSKKKRKVKSTPGPHPDGEKKRGPGRPKKEDKAKQLADQKLLGAYPSLSGKDEIAFFTFQECKCCRMWKGRMAIKPCGHALYCFGCMEKLKTEALELQRPAKCPADGCFSIVSSWFKLFNISP